MVKNKKTIEVFSRDEKKVYNRVRLNFDKFLDVPDSYNNFVVSISLKKMFSRLEIYNLLIEDNNKVLSFHKDLNKFLKDYYKVKQFIDASSPEISRGNGSLVQNMILSIIDENLVKALNDFVEDGISGKEVVKLERKENETVENAELNFNRDHIKVIFMQSFLIKLFVPLCIHYLHVCPEIPGTEFLGDTYLKFLNLIYPEYDIASKLYNFIKVMTNKNRQEPLWISTAFFGDSKESLVIDLLYKILINILPKLVFDGNVIGYISTCIKYSINNYTLRRNFIIKPVNARNLSSSDGSGEDDINIDTVFEGGHIRSTDEEKRILDKLETINSIKTLYKNNNIVYDPNIINYYMERVPMFEFQKMIVQNTMYRYFPSKETLESINEIEYYTLLYLTHKILLNKSLFRIGYILLCRIVGYKRNRNIVKDKIKNTNSYLKVLDRFKYVSNLYEENDIFITLVQQATREEFVQILYSNDRNYESFNEKSVNFQQGDIINEIGEFLLLVCE